MLIWKAAIFEFVNEYLSLYYIKANRLGEGNTVNYRIWKIIPVNVYAHLINERAVYRKSYVILVMQESLQEEFQTHYPTLSRTENTTSVNSITNAFKKN
jgi:hypothetical protein